MNKRTATRLAHSVVNRMLSNERQVLRATRQLLQGVTGDDRQAVIYAVGRLQEYHERLSRTVVLR